ncbi:MAG: type II toxin-antitoxin system VapC family toxin [Candidatus Aminicenantes bacterium]
MLTQHDKFDSKKLEISFYDASYLGLAHKEKAFLITADKRLLKECQKNFKWIRQL